MPELPEVEVLAQYLRPLLIGRTIRRVEIRRDKVLHPTRPAQFRRTLTGARFTQLVRRGKYLLFQLQSPRAGEPIELLGHLGMTGRMYLAPRRSPEPKHAAVVLHLGPPPPRYFGRAPGTGDYYAERLRVYDRAGEPCGRCGRPIRRIVQASRSTFFCPSCQK